MFSSLVRTSSLAFEPLALEVISEVKSQFVSPGLRFPCARLLPQLSPLVQAHCFCPRLQTLGCWPSTPSSYPMASRLLCLLLWPDLSLLLWSPHSSTYIPEILSSQASCCSEGPPPFFFFFGFNCWTRACISYLTKSTPISSYYSL